MVAYNFKIFFLLDMGNGFPMWEYMRKRIGSKEKLSESKIVKN